MDRAQMITTLQGTAPGEELIVDQQSANDIMKQIVAKHSECTEDYDKICESFDKGDIYDTSFSIWEFCKKNFNYVEEDTERQFTSCPYTMLKGGDVDCKNYSLFIAGVLDALRRRGRRFNWQFRFVSYYLLDPTPGHVFIVVNPSTDDIWIDPVLPNFNDHLFYWYKRDRSPRRSSRSGASIGRLPVRIGSTSAENSLLSDVLAYQQGLAGSIAQTQTTGKFNQVTESVLQTASKAIPGVSLALGALKAVAGLVDNTFGVGSTAGRLLTDLSNLNLQGLWNDIWGRTYNTDQYWGAVYYKFYVLGQNVTDQNQVSDSDVLPALKWFIDRTGVFISGREHIIALTQSPTAYMNYHSVNGDTTTDTTLVNAAYKVGSTYWKNPGNFNPAFMGSWANTVGVFDTGLAQIANSYGLTAEQYVAQTGTADQVAASYTEWIPGIPNVLTAVGLAALAIAAITSK